VIGTLLNKNVSTGDDWWGERWQLIPESLKCYALGDIQFGFMTYNILAGLLLRDVFPDPEILCKYLKCSQKDAADWFLELLLVSLEGVEYHQKAEEEAETREEMVLSLRYRNEREKLFEFSPLLIRLWTQILGKWPAPTSGGCRVSTGGEGEVSGPGGGVGPGWLYLVQGDEAEPPWEGGEGVCQVWARARRPGEASLVKTCREFQRFGEAERFEDPVVSVGHGEGKE